MDHQDFEVLALGTGSTCMSPLCVHVCMIRTYHQKCKLTTKMTNHNKLIHFASKCVAREQAISNTILSIRTLIIFTSASIYYGRGAGLVTSLLSNCMFFFLLFCFVFFSSYLQDYRTYPQPRTRRLHSVADQLSTDYKSASVVK